MKRGDLISRESLLKKWRFDNELVQVVDVMTIRKEPAIDADNVMKCRQCIFCVQDADLAPEVQAFKCSHPHGLKGRVEPDYSYCSNVARRAQDVSG